MRQRTAGLVAALDDRSLLGPILGAMTTKRDYISRVFALLAATTLWPSSGAVAQDRAPASAWWSGGGVTGIGR